MSAAAERIGKLREKMAREGIDYCYLTDEDAHQSEYSDSYFKKRSFISGFTGSAGSLLVGRDRAGLWTDGRYFLQAERELEGSGITLYRMDEEGAPTLEEYLEKELKEGQILSLDGRCLSLAKGEKLAALMEEKKGALRYQKDPLDGVWEDRPPRRAGKVFALPEGLCGLGAGAKLRQVREEMKKLGCAALALGKLDDVMWLFNLRGSDIACNPVALSYAILTEEEAYLFLQDPSQAPCPEGVTILDYDDFFPTLQSFPWPGKALLDEKNISYAIYQLVRERAQVVRAANPTRLLKAKKNGTELKRIRETYLKDSLAACRFMKWLKENIGRKEITELSAAAYMDGLRKHTEGFLDLSFPTICAYGENAAMMHYQATPENTKTLKPEGMLLIDSGGQYMGGTTDITRTYALGPVTEEMKRHYTLVAMGMLRLLRGRFLYGCSGRNVDILARGPLWDLGIDYKCGTGHGVGYILNVHEGPQNIRWRYAGDMEEAPLEEGMLLSNEPGVYRAGSYGIRIENIMAVKKGVKNGDGQFMEFECLTFAPIDLELIEPSLMEKRDIRFLNEYHQAVYEKIAPRMTQEEAGWLKAVTGEIS